MLGFNSIVVVLRATRKVLRALPPVTASAAASDTALGDWYVNRLVVDRQPLLLLVSSLSLLTIVALARNVRALPGRLPTMVADRLRRLGMAPALCDAEVAAMDPVQIGATQDPSVVGSMVDFAKTIPFHLPLDGWDETTLPFVEASLVQTPCRLGDNFENTIFPDAMTPRLLEAKWQ